jgi:hypothetical protein
MKKTNLFFLIFFLSLYTEGPEITRQSILLIRGAKALGIGTVK